jgi:hypothetical protein
MKPIAVYEAHTKSPGKFQGEKPLTVFIWEESLEGGLESVCDLERDGLWAEKIHLTGSEMEYFDTDVSEWIIVEDSQGFVMSMPADRFEEWRG